jgi:hypothetical protein
MKIINHLINSIRASVNHNPEAETRPHCILWTDKERQWENALKRIMPELPELLILGDYNPAERQGPAIWLRAAIGGCVDGYTLPYGRVPVLYLPGVSRQDLRAVEQCSDELKPLAELQYRGVIWSQVNARDWTIFAYLKTKKGRLGLDVNQDEATLQAMQRAINRLLDEKIENLKSNHLDKDFFNSLISGVDTVKDILLWMSGPENFKTGRTKEEWQAFVEICKSKYKFNPEQDGVFGASEKLGWRDDSWEIVWNRFCEAPAKYEAIPDILRKTVMPFIGNQDRFPQWNEQQENILRKELLKLSGMSEQAARDEILKLEKEHSDRRNSVWAELGEAPLARALRWISEIASKTTSVIVGDFDEIANAQDTWGWLVDYAAILALSGVEKQEDTDAIFSAIRSVYLPWIDINARNLQKAVKENGYPRIFKNPDYKHDECICFIDGLRFDLVKKLSEKFKTYDLNVKEDTVWTPLPTVTATCKPALTSTTDKITGDDLNNQDFTPIIKESGQLATSQRIYNLMEEQGWSILSDNTLDKQNKRGWYEFGRIDDEGHKIGWRIAPQVESYLNEVLEKVLKLFKAGWETVKIVSDHGWLLMPGGLPKMQMPTSLTESKWGRCAAIKPGALFDGTYYPWYWNESVNFALADGVSCYRNGIEYTHGGISLQECLMVQLSVSKNEEGQIKSNVLVTDIVWKGMRCKIAAEGDFKGIKADIRIKPVLTETSIVMGIKEFNEDGIASVVVDDDSQEGNTAYVILLDMNNNVIYQTTTVVGGEA